MISTINDIRKEADLITANMPEKSRHSLAEELGISEGKLTDSQVDENIIRLRNNLDEILEKIKSLGKVKTVLRNEGIILSVIGSFKNQTAKNYFELNKQSILKISKSNCAAIYAFNFVEHKSIQIFGKDGNAVLKIHLTPASNHKNFDKLTEKFKSENQRPGIKFKNKLLQSVKEIQPYNQEAFDLLEDLKERKIPIRISVKNSAGTLSYFGKIENQTEFNQWYHLRNSNFTLNLNQILTVSNDKIKAQNTQGEIIAEIHSDTPN